jgi:UDP-N-acetylglucosamine 1-carboxyvinyltransferase
MGEAADHMDDRRAPGCVEPSLERVYSIQGGARLAGEVYASGAKNAIGKQLVASLLADEPCLFTNVPRIAEIDFILAMLGDIGLEHEWLDEDALRVQTPEITTTLVREEYSGFNRIPILLLAPLHHRAGSATVPLLGGCKIGPRPVDFHIALLEAMGGELEEGPDSFTLTGQPLQGTVIELPYPSVGATESALMAACLARGRTVITNAAIEPEIIDTILLLQKMGALITVDVDRKLIIEGVDKLHGANHRVITDRIEVASFAAAAASTDGRITVVGAQQQHMITFLNMFRRAGGGFDVRDDRITFFRGPDGLGSVHFDTDVHPGFMTDWQQPFAVMLTQATGSSLIHETVYENRFGYTEALCQMGAEIELSIQCLGGKSCRFIHHNHVHSCIVRGPTALSARSITMPDLRAGFAYLIAALVADGTSELAGISYIERGYPAVPERLQEIGAHITVKTRNILAPRPPQ